MTTPEALAKLEEALEMLMCRSLVIRQFFPDWASGTKRRFIDLEEAYEAYRKAKEQDATHE